MSIKSIVKVMGIFLGIMITLAIIVLSVSYYKQSNNDYISKEDKHSQEMVSTLDN